MRQSASEILAVACVSILFTGLPAAQAQAAPEPTDAAIRNAIVRLEHEWLDVRDTGTLSRILADDFVHVLPADFVSKADEIGFRRKHGWNRPDEKTEFENLRVRVYGQIAIANGVVKATNNKTGIVRRTRFTDVFVFRDGRWQAVNAQELDVP